MSNLTEWYHRFKQFSNHMKKQNLSAYSSSTAFFFFLSLVPMLMVICTIIPYTPLTKENLLMFATEVLPEQFAPLAESTIGQVYEKSAGILSVAILTTVWSAGKGVLALMRGLNAVHNKAEKRPYIAIRMIATFYTMFMLLATMLSLALIVFGNQLLEKTLARIPGLENLVSFLQNFRFLAVWVVLTLVFAVIYTFVPDKKLYFRDQLYGAAMASISWIVFSWGFSLYVEWADFSIYGNLSLIVMVMLWMYACMYILFMFAYLNRYFAPLNRRTETKRRKKA